MPSSSDEKRAEFAKLFDLFEMLATRRSQVTVTQSIVDDTCGIPIPADLEPVFHSLATVVPPRSVRPRRNTVAALGRTATYADDASDTDSDMDEEEKSLAKFPLGKTYAFTFKMMIHKLYQVDEWAQKVRDVLQRSQIEYKPLAEQPILKRTDGPAAAADGRVHFNKSPIVQRTQSRGTLHAIKKRCIGRRKTLSSVLAPDAPIGEGWFYDSAVSAAEVRERVPVETTASFTAASRTRPRYQSLQTGARTGLAPRRIVSASITTNQAASPVVPRTSAKRRLSQGV
ncbi:hypothetical protein FB45DRAFT_991727 [Roridomyces roridus]|uniref:Uncharacterized protein n=1 Tax=Roridomyces roridus TaxID=1738132 RepID=A0AAD7FGQ2_9AGAR|nr:hypothetical protein FB45DRAFT_991727 [Roridomyces roridus]